MKNIEIPRYDDAGINLADPHDRLGLKTEYISRLQLEALSRYVGFGDGLAVDVGCGYGRMTHRISTLGYDVLGVEPSLRVLRHAADSQPSLGWVVGRLPDLPVANGSAALVLLLNVVRSLHLLGLLGLCTGAVNAIKPGGRLVILDNIRDGDGRYVDETWFVEFFAGAGLELEKRVAIRGSRWPIIYMIRYGLIPARWFDKIIDWELRRMLRKKKSPKWSYHNVIFIFRKP